MNNVQEFILNSYTWDQDETPEDAPENKKENYFSICHYILKTAQKEACKKDEILTFSRFSRWISGLPSIFDILYTFENAADTLIKLGVKINKSIYVRDKIKIIYEELLKAEEYYNFFKVKE